MPGRYKPSYARSYEERNQKTRREDIKFYQSKEWRLLRDAHLRSSPLCLRCQQEGYAVGATAVHHIVEVKQDPSRALDPTNLESTCPKHHREIHNERRPNPEKGKP